MFVAWALGALWSPSRRVVAQAGLLLAAALATAFAPLPAAASDIAFLLCWAIIVLNAIAAITARALPVTVGLALAMISGIAAGSVAGIAHDTFALVVAAPLVLVGVARALIHRSMGKIVVRIVASWLIAIALLSITIPLLVATPGYRRDHME